MSKPSKLLILFLLVTFLCVRFQTITLTDNFLFQRQLVDTDNITSEIQEKMSKLPINVIYIHYICNKYKHYHFPQNKYTVVHRKYQFADITLQTPFTSIPCRQNCKCQMALSSQYKNKHYYIIIVKCFVCVWFLNQNTMKEKKYAIVKTPLSG